MLAPGLAANHEAQPLSILTVQEMKRGIVALPVFDCVVVKASTEVITQREFKAVGGLTYLINTNSPELRCLTESDNR
jgi:hypothetical protein